MKRIGLAALTLMAFLLLVLAVQAAWAGPPKSHPKPLKVKPPRAKLPVKKPLRRRLILKQPPLRKPVLLRPHGVIYAPKVALPPPPAGPIKLVVQGKPVEITVPAWTGELQAPQRWTTKRYIAKTGNHVAKLYVAKEAADFDLVVRAPGGHAFARGHTVGGEAVDFDVWRPGEFTFEVIAKQGSSPFLFDLD